MQLMLATCVAHLLLTRSYRRWSVLPDGTSFTHNQTYVRGRDGHDWLLRKNIWRRMRYRRENRAKFLNLRARGGWVGGGEGEGEGETSTSTAGRGNAEEEVRDGRQRAVGEEGAHDDDEHQRRLLVVSRAVEDAAAAAMARNGFFNHSIDANAVAALTAGGRTIASRCCRAHWTRRPVSRRPSRWRTRRRRRMGRRARRRMTTAAAVAAARTTVTTTTTTTTMRAHPSSGVFAV
jgi:hypothetical protein